MSYARTHRGLRLLAGAILVFVGHGSPSSADDTVSVDTRRHVQEERLLRDGSPAEVAEYARLERVRERVRELSDDLDRKLLERQNGLVSGGRSEARSRELGRSMRRLGFEQRVRLLDQRVRAVERSRPVGLTRGGLR